MGRQTDDYCKIGLYLGQLFKELSIKTHPGAEKTFSRDVYASVNLFFNG